MTGYRECDKESHPWNQQTYVNELQRHLWSDVDALRQTITSLWTFPFHQQLSRFLAVQCSTSAYFTMYTTNMHHTGTEVLLVTVLTGQPCYEFITPDKSHGLTTIFYAGLSYNLASVQKTNIIYPNNVHKFATVINNNFWHVIFLMATAQQ